MLQGWCWISIVNAVGPSEITELRFKSSYILWIHIVKSFSNVGMCNSGIITGNEFNELVTTVISEIRVPEIVLVDGI